MITLVVAADGRASADVARTLRAFVPAVVDGVVVDGVVVGADEASVRPIADAFGVALAPAGGTDWLREMRGRFLLVMAAGTALSEGWTAEVERFAGQDGAMPARFRGEAGRSLLSFFRRPDALARGLLIRRERAETALKAGTGLEALARGRAAATLAATIVRAA